MVGYNLRRKEAQNILIFSFVHIFNVLVHSKESE
jgi:hypothetical protein